MQSFSCKDLCKRFGSKVAVDNVTLDLPKGEIIGLVGPDGAGKTTLIRMLATVLSPTSGDAFIEGLSVKTHQKEILGKIGYVSQSFGLYGDMTVLENLHFFADIFGTKGKKEKIEKLLEFSKLKAFQDFQADQLSGGMKQKLSLSCALIHDPEILLLDEPTNGVDPVSRRDFWNILRKLELEGKTILLSTSYLDEAERCSLIIFFNEGKVLAKGSLEELQLLLKGEILEVKCEAPRKALLALRESFGHDVVKLFGNRIHIYLYAKDGEESLQRVKEILREHTFSVRRMPPTLEDIFMAMMRDNA